MGVPEGRGCPKGPKARPWVRIAIGGGATAGPTAVRTRSANPIRTRTATVPVRRSIPSPLRGTTTLQDFCLLISIVKQPTKLAPAYASDLAAKEFKRTGPTPKSGRVDGGDRGVRPEFLGGPAQGGRGRDRERDCLGPWSSSARHGDGSEPQSIRDHVHRTSDGGCGRGVSRSEGRRGPNRHEHTSGRTSAGRGPRCVAFRPDPWRHDGGLHRPRSVRREEDRRGTPGACVP